MKYNSSQNDGDRRSSGGNYRGRNNNNGSGRQRSNRGRSYSDSGSGYNPVNLTPKLKMTFWQKLLSFFGVKKTTAAPVGDRRDDRRPDRARSTHSAPIAGASREQRPARKAERIEVTSPKLYVGNLAYEASENDLAELFNGVGKVRSAEVVSNPHTQRSKGFAFVQMESIDEARRAVVELHDKEFMGRKLVVSGAKTNDPQMESAERTTQTF